MRSPSTSFFPRHSKNSGPTRSRNGLVRNCAIGWKFFGTSIASSPRTSQNCAPGSDNLTPKRAGARQETRTSETKISQGETPMSDRKATADFSLSRRSMLAAAAGLGAGAFARLTPASGQGADTPILRRPIPHGGEMLPVVGLGTSRVFAIGSDAKERAERRAVLEALVAAGGSLIDTASTYGTAEGVVGDLVAEAGLRDKVFLATKCEVRSRAATIAEMQQSLRKLKTPKVDLMQLHNVTDAKTDLGLLREWKA